MTIFVGKLIFFIAKFIEYGKRTGNIIGTIEILDIERLPHMVC